jgi:hypothetical protein
MASSFLSRSNSKRSGLGGSWLPADGWVMRGPAEAQSADGNRVSAWAMLIWVGSKGESCGKGETWSMANEV